MKRLVVERRPPQFRAIRYVDDNIQDILDYFEISTSRAMIDYSTGALVINAGKESIRIPYGYYVVQAMPVPVSGQLDLMVLSKEAFNSTFVIKDVK